MTPTKQRLLVIGLIVVGLAFVAFFGIRFFHAFREFNGHRPHHFPPPGSQPIETDVSLIRDWMTIGYLSEAYRLPRNLLYEAVNIPPNGNEHKSLKQLNDKYYPQEPSVVLEKVKAAILANEPPATAVPATTNLAIPSATLVPTTKP
jgi:hypothetical protein